MPHWSPSQLAVVAALVFLGSCTPKSGPSVRSTETTGPTQVAVQPSSAEPEPVAFEWEPDRWSTDPVALAGDGLLLRERHALLFVDLRGAQRWRREWSEELEVVVPLEGGVVAVADSSERLSLLALDDGKVQAALKLPRSVTAGSALPGGGGAFFDTGHAVFLRGNQLTESARRYGSPRVEAVVRDPKGRFWLQGLTSWSMLDANGKLLVAWKLEGEEGSHSFPPAFLGDRAWFFQGSDSATAALLEVELDSCLADPANHSPYAGFPEKCVVARAKRPELYRDPEQASAGNLIVLSHGAYERDDGSLVDRHLEAFRGTKPLWKKSLGRLGVPAPVMICGGALFVNDRGDIVRYRLSDGSYVGSVGYAQWLECTENRLVLVSYKGVQTVDVE